MLRLRDIRAKWQWRHALLLIGLLFATEQVRSSSNVYLQYLSLRETSILGEGNQILQSLRRHMFRNRGSAPLEEIIDSYFEEHQARGVRYVFYWQPHRDKRKWVEAGDRTFAPDLPLQFERQEFSRDFERERGERALMMNPNPEDIRRLYGWRPRQRRSVRPGGPETRGAPPIQMIEFIPLKTNELRDQALVALVLGLLGALASMLGSAYAWQLIGKNQAAEAKLQDQRILAALGQMSSILAHELRNPLSAAMGQTQLLEMMLPEGKARDRAETIGRELEELEELSNNLLDFVNSRRVEPQVQSCDAFLRNIERLARDPRLRIFADDAPETWTFDTVTMLRAMDNVVSNALSFTPEDGWVDVTMRQDGESLRIEVRDAGPGFPEDLSVFDPFVTTRAQGTGLGLAITQEIVRAHGGTIAASNPPDGGALVVFTLPFVDGLTQASFFEV